MDIWTEEKGYEEKPENEAERGNRKQEAPNRGTETKAKTYQKGKTGGFRLRKGGGGRGESCKKVKKKGRL